MPQKKEYRSKEHTYKNKIEGVIDYFSEPYLLDAYSNIEGYRVGRRWLLSELRPNTKLLDVGCGSGGFAKLTSQKGIRVTGIDISPAMIKKAKEINYEDNVKLKVADISKWKSKEKFDYITAFFNLLSFIPSRKERIQAMDNMVFMLKENGRLYLTFTKFHLRMLLKSIFYFCYSTLRGQKIEFWDSYNPHHAFRKSVFKHNLLPYELKSYLKQLLTRYELIYEFRMLNEEFALVINKK